MKCTNIHLIVINKISVNRKNIRVSGRLLGQKNKKIIKLKKIKQVKLMFQK